VSGFGKLRVIPISATHSVLYEYPRCVPVVRNTTRTPRVGPRDVEIDRDGSRAWVGSRDRDVRDGHVAAPGSGDREQHARKEANDKPVYAKVLS
jgi:hypothetical protein